MFIALMRDVARLPAFGGTEMPSISAAGEIDHQDVYAVNGNEETYLCREDHTSGPFFRKLLEVCLSIPFLSPAPLDACRDPAEGVRSYRERRHCAHCRRTLARFSLSPGFRMG